MGAPLYILVGMFGGAFLIGMIIAVVVFFRELRALRESLDQATSVFRTLSKNNALEESMKSFGDIVSTGQGLMKKMDVLNNTVQSFYDVAIQANRMAGRAAEPQPADTDSAIYTSDEEQMAQQEIQRRLRHTGVKAQPAEVEIDSGKAVKAGDV
jgi:hypothetical protein